jgi:hypothetical protein
LNHHPSHFLLSLTNVLPFVLSHLLSDSSHIRHQAVWAIQGFASAKINCKNLSGSICDNLSHHVRSFIDSQTAPHEARLPTIVTAAITAEEPSHPGEGPQWAFTVLSSFIVLLGSSLFSHPRSLKFILPSLARSLTHKRRAVRSLHPQVWKCLVWAFSRISVDSFGAHEANGGADKSSFRTEECALLVVKQELRRDAGVTLVSSLLGMAAATESGSLHSGTDYVTKALDVLKEMVFSDSKSTQAAGLSLLARLLSSVGASSTATSSDCIWDYDVILPRSLLDGTILRTKWDQLPDVTRSLAATSCSEVRQLSEMQIIQHWDELLVIWVKSVKIALQESGVMQVCVIIMSTPTHVTDYLLGRLGSHLAATPACAVPADTGM